MHALGYWEPGFFFSFSSFWFCFAQLFLPLVFSPLGVSGLPGSFFNARGCWHEDTADTLVIFSSSKKIPRRVSPRTGNYWSFNPRTGTVMGRQCFASGATHVQEALPPLI